MPSRAEAVSVERLRQMLAACVQVEGLRPVARDIGLDPKAITKLINGAEPRTSTRQKLTRWYLRQIAAGYGSTDPESANTALGVLLRDLPPSARAGGFQRAVAAFREIYVDATIPLPEWLSHLERQEEAHGREE